MEYGACQMMQFKCKMWNMLNAVLCGMLCEMWCDARCGGVMYVANIGHDPKCGVMWIM